MGQKCGRCPLFFRVIEDTHAIDLGFTHEIAEALEGSLVLARVADDECGTQGEVGDDAAGTLDHVAHRLAGVATAHLLQDLVVDVLHRYVQVLRDARLARHHVQELVGDGRGIGIMQANPAQTLDLGEAPQQSGEVRSRVGFAIRQIAAVGGEILCDEADLGGAPGCHGLGFTHHRIGLTAALRTAQLGDDAKCARSIAALGDLQIGRVRRHRGGTRGVIVIQIARGLGDMHALICALAAYRLDDLAHLVGADEGVDLGHFVGELLRITLGKATRDDEALAAAGLLELAHVEDGVDGLLLGLADESAGVDDDDLGLAGLSHDLQTGLVDHSEHDLGVDPVFGTAERYEMDACGHGAQS